MTISGNMRASHRDSVAARGRTALLTAEIFAAMRLRGAIGFAAGGDAHAGIALGQREVRAAEQRHCNGNDAHDFLHGSLLSLAGLLRGLPARCASHARDAAEAPAVDI